MLLLELLLLALHRMHVPAAVSLALDEKSESVAQ
jgi:hypothetical protein